MVTEPDLWAIKLRVVDILKANSTLWEKDNHEKGFQVIEAGLPDNAKFEGLVYPVCYITNAQNNEDDQPFGPVSNNSMGSSKHIFRLSIMFFDQKDDGQECEKSVDTLHKNIKEVLKGNVSLRDPDDPTNTATALCVESQVRLARTIGAEFDGKPLNGKILTMVLVVQSN